MLEADTWQERGEVELEWHCAEVLEDGQVCGRTDQHVHAEYRLRRLWFASLWRARRFAAGLLAVWALSTSGLSLGPKTLTPPIPRPLLAYTETVYSAGALPQHPGSVDTGSSLEAPQGILGTTPTTLGVALDDTHIGTSDTPRAAGATSTRGAQPPGPTGTTSTFVAVAPTPAVRVWQPADECSRLLRPVSAAVARWCPYTAQALYEGVRRGAWTWNRGDLSRLMNLISCESNGNPRAKNPHSTASGLGQFLNSTWARWAPRAAAFYGFNHPGVFFGYDNILTTVYLAKVGSWEHWQCWKQYE